MSLVENSFAYMPPDHVYTQRDFTKTLRYDIENSTEEENYFDGVDHEYAHYEPLNTQYVDHEYADFSRTSSHEYADFSHTNTKTLDTTADQENTNHEHNEFKAFVRKRRRHNSHSCERTKVVTAGDFPSKSPGESLLKHFKERKSARSDSGIISGQSSLQEQAHGNTTNFQVLLNSSKLHRRSQLSISVPQCDLQGLPDNEAPLKGAVGGCAGEYPRVVLSPIDNRKPALLPSPSNPAPPTSHLSPGGHSNRSSLSYESQSDVSALCDVDVCSDHMYSMQIPTSSAADTLDHSYSHVTTASPNQQQLWSHVTTASPNHQQLWSRVTTAAPNQQQLWSHVTSITANLEQDSNNVTSTLTKQLPGNIMSNEQTNQMQEYPLVTFLEACEQGDMKYKRHRESVVLKSAVENHKNSQKSQKSNFDNTEQNLNENESITVAVCARQQTPLIDHCENSADSLSIQDCPNETVDEVSLSGEVVEEIDIEESVASHAVEARDDDVTMATVSGTSTGVSRDCSATEDDTKKLPKKFDSTDPDSDPDLLKRSQIAAEALVSLTEMCVLQSAQLQSNSAELQSNSSALQSNPNRFQLRSNKQTNQKASIMTKEHREANEDLRKRYITYHSKDDLDIDYGQNGVSPGLDALLLADKMSQGFSKFLFNPMLMHMHRNRRKAGTTCNRLSPSYTARSNNCGNREEGDVRFSKKYSTGLQFDCGKNDIVLEFQGEDSKSYPRLTTEQISRQGMIANELGMNIRDSCTGSTESLVLASKPSFQSILPRKNDSFQDEISVNNVGSFEEPKNVDHNNILNHIDSIIHQNKSKLDSLGQSPDKITRKCDDNTERGQSADDIRKSSLKRIEDLLKQNETSVTNSAKSVATFQQNLTKLTLSDKIRQVKETLKLASNPQLSLSSTSSIAKTDAIRRIEQLIAENEKNIQSNVQTDQNSAENVHAAMTTVSEISVPSQPMASQRKRSRSLSQGHEEVSIKQRMDDEAIKDVKDLLVLKKAKTDSVHDHAYFTSKTTPLVKHAKVEAKSNAKIAKPLVKLKRDSLHYVKTNHKTVKRPQGTNLGTKSQHYSMIVQDDITSMTSQVMSTVESRNTNEAGSRAILRDHTYEEDQVNTQQFSIQRDHSYKKLQKSRRHKNGQKASGVCDHSYTPNV